MLVWTNIVLGWKGPHSEKVRSSVRMVSGGCPVWAMTCYHLSIIDHMWYYRCDEILTALARSWEKTTSPKKGETTPWSQVFSSTLEGVLNLGLNMVHGNLYKYPNL